MQIVGWQLDRLDHAIVAEDLVQVLFDHVSAQTAHVDLRGFRIER